MIRELMVNVAKNVPANYSAAAAMVTGMGVTIDFATGTLALPSAETAEGIHFLEKERTVEGIYASLTDFDDYFEQFVNVKEGEFAEAIPAYAGEMYGTDQYDTSVKAEAIGKRLAVGADGKWKVASTNVESRFILAGMQTDGTHTLAMIAVTDATGKNA